MLACFANVLLNRGTTTAARAPAVDAQSWRWR